MQNLEIQSTNAENFLKHKSAYNTFLQRMTKDYEKSNDFYVGEMEARQSINWNPILTIYRFSSFYGTNYIQAFRLLLFLFIV